MPSRYIAVKRPYTAGLSGQPILTRRRVNFTHPKRRFGKAEPTFQSAFSKHFSRVCVPDLVATTVKTVASKKSHFQASGQKSTYDSRYEKEVRKIDNNKSNDLCSPNEDFGTSKNIWVRPFVSTFHTQNYSIWAKSDEKCLQKVLPNTFSTFQNLLLGSM
jgi:hypothetical protein